MTQNSRQTVDIPAIRARLATYVKDMCHCASCVERRDLWTNAVPAALSELAAAKADGIALTVATNALRAIELLAPQDGDDEARCREKFVSVFALTKVALTTLGSVEDR